MADEIAIPPEELRRIAAASAQETRPAGERWPPGLDLEKLAEHEPQPPAFIVPDWLPIGYATLLAGHGGQGKSNIALYFAVCAGAGRPFFGLDVARRRTMYLSCEDREGVLHWRLARICKHLRVDLARQRGWLEIVDLVGLECTLWERDPRTGFTITAAFGELAERVKAHETELVIVDAVSDTFGGYENARGDVKRYVNALVGLIPPERGAVLLVGHIAKPAAASAATTEGYSGSTGWHNSVRARWYLYPETEQGEDGGRPERTGDLILELQKSNLGRIDQQMRFRWDDDAHLFVGELVGASAFDRKHHDRTEQDGIRRAMKACADAGLYVPAAMTGPRTAYLVLCQRPEFPESLRGNNRVKTRRFWRQIEALRHMRHVEDSSIGRKHRKHTATIVLTSEGCAACA